MNFYQKYKSPNGANVYNYNIHTKSSFQFTAMVFQLIYLLTCYNEQ